MSSEVLHGAPEVNAHAEDLVQQRSGPALIVFTTSLHPLYLTREAQRFSALLNRARVGQPANGVLPREVLELCDDLVKLFSAQPDPKEREQIQLNRVVGDPQRPVLLRGFGVPSPDGVEDGRLIILMEEIAGRRRAGPVHVKERFHLTDREQTTIIYLMKGLTNKEIAGRLGVTETTVKEHLQHIMRKTKTSNRTALLAQILLETCP